MQASKKWEKIDDSTFAFWDNNQNIGTMEIVVGAAGRKATATIQGQKFAFKKIGFWKTSLEMTGTDSNVVARMYPEKWYANTFILEYDNKKYKLSLRNNPLAEWVLQDDNIEVLAYGLSTQNRKVSVKITNGSVQPNYLFDFILWYLFAPIAIEQGADDFTFLLLIA